VVDPADDGLTYMSWPGATAIEGRETHELVDLIRVEVSGLFDGLIHHFPFIDTTKKIKPPIRAIEVQSVWPRAVVTALEIASVAVLATDPAAAPTTPPICPTSEVD
jgi:hypothetical protein